VQSVAVMSISLFAYFSHEKSIIEIPLANTLICIGFFCLLLIFYLLYKWIAYRIIINVFFDKSRGMFWTKDWSSLIFLSGLVMFLPAVFIYFVPHLYYFSFYVLVLWFFITRMIIIHKSYMIFFNRINSLHHLFLYLCAQEIVPLFLTYKSMVYVFDIVVDKGILWI
jgi:hypothetical protein